MHHESRYVSVLPFVLTEAETQTVAAGLNPQPEPPGLQFGPSPDLWRVAATALFRITPGAAVIAAHALG
jgi:hypothetical protein